MQTQLKNISEKKKGKRLIFQKEDKKIVCITKTKKIITKIKFFYHFPTIKSRLFCKKYMLR